MSTTSCISTFLFALSLSARAQVDNGLYSFFESDSLARPGLTGMAVRQVKTHPFGNKTMTEITTTETFYDDAGRRTEIVFSNEQGRLSRTSFGYDSISRRLNYVLFATEKTKQEAFAAYDSLGRLAEILICPEDKPCQRRRYRYDEDHTERAYVARRTIRLERGKKAGSLFGLSTTEKETDELVRERYFDPEGRLEEIRYFTSDTFCFGTIFQYDISGRKTGISFSNGTSEAPATEFQYDDRGRVVSEKNQAWMEKCAIRVVDDAKVIRYEYDDRNRLTRAESGNDRFSSVSEYTYFTK